VKINRHLMKKSPSYRLKSRPYLVKLIKIIDWNTFSAEIISGTSVGKWTTVKRSELKRGNNK